MNSQPHRPSAMRLRSLLERSREDVAMLMARQVEAQQQLHALIGVTGDLWQEVFGEEAPEFELSVTKRASA